MSDVSPDLIQAYKDAYYCVFMKEKRFDLRIGEKSEFLQSLCMESGSKSALFITAYNPEGIAHPSDENIKFQRELGDIAANIADLIFEGEGGDPSGIWPPEQSYLIIGVDRSTSIELGKRFRQNAILWIGSDYIPELVMLR
jgi:Protein of unknown function (DUF3293)